MGCMRFILSADEPPRPLRGTFLSRGRLFDGSVRKNIVTQGFGEDKFTETGDNRRIEEKTEEKIRIIRKFSRICGCDISVKALYYIVLLALGTNEC